MDQSSVEKIAKKIAHAPSKIAASRILITNGLSPGSSAYTDFVNSVRDALNRPGEYLKLTPEELVEFLDYLPRFVAMSIDRLPSKLNADQLHRVLAQEPGQTEQVAAAGPTVTTTANTAPYPVPIGQKMLRRKMHEAFERNVSVMPKWLVTELPRHTLRLSDLIE